MFMKLLVVCTFLVVLSSFGSRGEPTSVYICDSPYATKYHYNKSCEGLSKCIHEIKQLTLTEAQEKKYSLCGYEKKK